MPRPDSKIMQVNPAEVSDATVKAPRVRASAPGKAALLGAVSIATVGDSKQNADVAAGKEHPVTQRPDPVPAAAPAKVRLTKEDKAIALLSKPERKAKIVELKAAHKLGRGPLDEAEKALADLNKLSLAADKEHKKAVAALAATEAKRQKQFDKDYKTISDKIFKYDAQYQKAQAKFDAEIAKYAD